MVRLWNSCSGSVSPCWWWGHRPWAGFSWNSPGRSREWKLSAGASVNNLTRDQPLLTLSGVAVGGARGQREVAGAAAHSLAPSHVLLAQRVVAVVRGAWRGNNIKQAYSLLNKEKT